LSAQNRVFKTLGYDNVHYFENAPEFESTLAGAASS